MEEPGSFASLWNDTKSRVGSNRLADFIRQARGCASHGAERPIGGVVQLWIRANGTSIAVLRA